MTVKMKKKGGNLRTGDLEELKRQMGDASLTDYYSFLAENNGGTPDSNEFEIPGTANSSGVNEFLCVRDVLSEKKKLSDRMPASAWPIAYAEGGNYVCLVTGDKRGVYFWDHELEVEEGRPPSWANMSRLSDTFTAFWQGLRKFDASSIELKPGQVKSIWVDPDFKPEF